MGDIDLSNIDFSVFARSSYRTKSAEDLRKEANSSSCAAYELGERYRRNGDLTNALKYYKQAEQLGDKGAIIKIANIYDAKKQFSDAAAYYQRAIEQSDDVDAYVNLAMYYINKKVGFRRRDREGHNMLLTAAKKGYAKAQYLVALTYCEGIGTHRDMGEYVLWMRCAQRNGYAQADGHIRERMSDPRYTGAWESMIAKADKRLNQHDEYFAFERLVKHIQKSDI